MKALILTGGLGTRLRPFTCDMPKPLLPVVNRPFLHYQLKILRQYGIRQVILATAYKLRDFQRILGNGRNLGLRIHYAYEKTPLGTGGAVRNALAHLDGATLVLNGDVLNALNIRDFIKQHERNKAEASIALVRVKDPTLYGLVETNAQGRILRFLEKPSWDEITCNTINAGAYLFELPAISLIPLEGPYSLERGLFPRLLEKGRRLFGFTTGGYWMDIGTVEKYLQVHLDILGQQTPFTPSLRRRGNFWLEPSVRLSQDLSHEGSGQVVFGQGTAVGPYVRLIGSVCVGPRCRIEQGAVLENCVVLGGSWIGKGARLERCIIGRRCVISHHAFVGPGRALGDGSVVQKFSQL